MAEIDNKVVLYIQMYILLHGKILYVPFCFAQLTFQVN